MATVVTSIDQAAGGIRIDWIKPHDGYQQITGYVIEIQANNLDWFEEITYCGGSDPLATFCLIPMDTLYEPPYSLTFQKLVKVRATAINSYGKSLKPSDSNTAGV